MIVLLYEARLSPGQIRIVAPGRSNRSIGTLFALVTRIMNKGCELSTSYGEPPRCESKLAEPSRIWTSQEGCLG